ncbi:peroxiredoxin-2E, chloroplastic-like [Impatiens glandulifera]|uniref:peroxiredoxin-2E, chloroplastic-like n=1 Tax=Impatiens glandulifera TaxID=253017 RepID=UPI001FB124C5|nr:peroxiredoxin-2E, chloroplastic-like [Impatiens glandulifera]
MAANGVIVSASRFLASSNRLSIPSASASPFTVRPHKLASSFSTSSLPLTLRRSISQPPTFSTAITKTKISSAISVGDKLPDATLGYLNDSDEVQTVTISDLTKGKKVVFFAVPGAFTPTCSQKHLPGFVDKSAELKAKGIDTIACISVNDVFVMKAWKKDLGIGDEVVLLSDGNGTFTNAIGCELDLSDKPIGLGVRSRRYSMLVDDGVVKALNLEEGGAFTFSGADDILKLL